MPSPYDGGTDIDALRPSRPPRRRGWCRLPDRVAAGVRAGLLPAAALLAVVVLDLVAAARWWPVPVVAALDEPAHLLTAWLVLEALSPRWRPALRWTLLGAVAIDVDHVPLYLWHVGTATESGRPVTHCLLTVLVLLVGASVVRRGRTVLAALAAGVALHLLRDLGTGPGVPLLWPVSGASVLVPHSCYLGVLAVAVGTAAWWRWDAGQRRPSPSTAGQGRR